MESGFEGIPTDHLEQAENDNEDEELDESVVGVPELPGIGFVGPGSREVEAASNGTAETNAVCGRCTVEGCKRKAVDGLCRQHGGKQEKIPCKVQGCS